MTSEPPAIVADNHSSIGLRTCRLAQILLIVVATMLHSVFLMKSRPLQSANDRSRWSTAWSLIERGTFQIDEIQRRPGWETIDLVRVDDHLYSTKPPLLTVVVAGVTWCVQKITWWNLHDYTQLLTSTVLFFVNVIPFVISLVVWLLILELVSENYWTRLYILTVAAFGTLITPFLMTLNNHSVAATSALIALYALVKVLKSNAGQSPAWAFALCGIATGWTMANELPAAALGLMIFLLLAGYSVRSTALYFVPAAALPLFALVATNVVATGSWKPVYANYGTEKYRFVIEGVPSYWSNPMGIDQGRDSPGTYLLHCTIGHHGIFSLTPVTILALIGWLVSFAVRDRALRWLCWLSGTATVIVIAFYLTRTQNYNYGGVSCGLRWAIWLTPFWLIASVPVLDAAAKSKLFNGFAVVLAMASIYSAWQPIENPWRHPWLFKWMESRGWIDYSDPRPRLDRDLWTWFKSLPTSDEPAWVEFSVVQPGMAARVVRLTGTPASAGGHEQLEFEIRQSIADSSEPAKVRKLLINRSNFDKGDPPADFLRWPDSTVSEAQQLEDLAFVRGLPRKVPFEARVTRYLKTSVRQDAFQCLLATAHVSFAPDETGPTYHYRCETWLTDEIPFGAAQIEWQISQPMNGAIVFHERWIVRDCWPKPPARSSLDAMAKPSADSP